MMLAARGAVALSLGEREDAAQLFELAARRLDDCALRSRLAELGRGEACQERLAGRLGPADLAPPAAFALVSPGVGEKLSVFLVSAMGDAMDALAPAGALSIESTADRFRVTGSGAEERIDAPAGWK